MHRLAHSAIFYTLQVRPFPLNGLYRPLGAHPRALAKHTQCLASEHHDALVTAAQHDAEVVCAGHLGAAVLAINVHKLVCQGGSRQEIWLTAHRLTRQFHKGWSYPYVLKGTRSCRDAKRPSSRSGHLHRFLSPAIFVHNKQICLTTPVSICWSGDRQQHATVLARSMSPFHKQCA